MTAGVPNRPYTRLARDRRFAPFVGAGLVSNVGNWFHVITSVIVVFDMTDSALMVGLVSFANFAAFLVLTPLAGSLTDRFAHRDVLLWAQVGSTLTAGLLGLAFILGNGSVSLVIVVSLLLGIGSAFSIPAMLSIVPDLVHRSDHGAAITMNAMAINVARLIGPVLGAAVLTASGPGAAFMMNALSFLVYALVVYRLPQRAHSSPVDRDPDGRYRVALKLVWSQPPLRRRFLGIAIVGVLLEPNTTLTAPLAASLGSPSGLVGPLVAAFGAGALLGAWPSRRTGLTRVPLGAVGFAVAAGSLAMVVLGRVPVLALIGFAGLGAGYLITISALTTEIQQAVPIGVRGRVMALWSQVLLGARPVTALVLGGIADSVNVQAALIVVALLAALGVGLLLRRQDDDLDVAGPRT